MPDRESPTLRRRRLAAELRRLRAERGMSSTEVAREVEWSPGKLTRLERNEGRRPSPRDVQDLCRVYQTDDRITGYLMQLARDGRRKGWWDPYDKMLSEAMTTFIGLEAEASSVLIFEPLAVPGLLQTDAYARAVIRGGPVKIADDQVEMRAEIRLRRQKALLDDEHALQIVAVMDEAALHRQVGGCPVMGPQIEHLREMARLPNVTLHVIPFSAGAHAGMSSSFNILQFPEPTDQDAVFADLVAGEMFIEEPSEVKRYHAAFLHLVGAAVGAGDTLALLDKRSSPRD